MDGYFYLSVFIIFLFFVFTLGSKKNKNWQVKMPSRVTIRVIFALVLVCIFQNATSNNKEISTLMRMRFLCADGGGIGAKAVGGGGGGGGGDRCESARPARSRASF